MLPINEWTKASKSGQNDTGPNCVEALNFRKASKSGPNSDNCVEMTFAKASKSGAAGHCVEMTFAKASGSTTNMTCVEAGPAADTHTGCTDETCLTPGINDGDIVVRDSKIGDDSPLIVFTPEQWAVFTREVAEGREDRDGDDYVIVDPRGTGIVLRFNHGEWDAFQDGCRKNEFAAA